MPEETCPYLWSKCPLPTLTPEGVFVRKCPIEIDSFWMPVLWWIGGNELAGIDFNPNPSGDGMPQVLRVCEVSLCWKDEDTIEPLAEFATTGKMRGRSVCHSILSAYSLWEQRKDHDRREAN